MAAKYLGLLVVLTLTVLGFSNGELITSPELTNWGTWAEETEMCPNGTYAQGFQLLVETWSGAAFDDTSLNGIKLFCGNPIEEGVKSVTSLVGSWGKWRNLYRCGPDDVIVGFQLRVEKNGIDLDETATNNIRIFCNLTTNYIEGDGERWGVWSEVRRCPPNQAVCGIRTQVQADRGILCKHLKSNIEKETKRVFQLITHNL